MSRPQISFPEKSNALKTPVPVITHTVFPSVTGDGDDMFCLRILVLPPPSSFFQRSSPLLRSTHQRKRLPPSATFRKIRSPQMIGVAPVQLGIPSFQVTFSSALHRTGRFFSALVPFRKGPRHCGQLSATTDTAASATTSRERNSFRIWVFPLLRQNQINNAAFVPRTPATRSPTGGTIAQDWKHP